MPRYLNIIFNLLGLFVIIYLGVDIFYQVIESRFVEPPVSRPAVPRVADQASEKVATAGDYRIILQRNIFGATDQEEAAVEAVEVATLEPTKLRLSLLGTVAGKDQDAGAIIQDQNAKKQDLYRIGDSVQGATIRQIFRNKVVLHVNGRDEILTMEESSRSDTAGPSAPPVQRVDSPETASQELTIDRADIEESLTNINQILTQVRIRPYFKDGKAEGLIISHLRPDSMFTTLGLQNGDIIRTINGNPIKTPDDAIALYQHLKSGSSIAIEVTRRGQPEILNYNIRE